MALENLGVPDMVDDLVQEKTNRLIDAITRIWEKFSELTGETFEGITFTVNPQYYIGENGSTVHVIADTETLSGEFEKLQIFINNELVSEHKNVHYLEEDIHIDGTSTITCTAIMNGIPYVKSKTITHYDSFWVGAGLNYLDVMKIENLKTIKGGLKSNHDITFNDGDKLFVIIGEDLENDFTRVDYNGIEVQFEVPELITINGMNYKVYASINSYTAGIINIDINS